MLPSGNVLNEKEFTGLVTEKFQECLIGCSFAFPEELIIHVYNANNEKSIVFLGNAYRDYQQSPEELSDIVDDQVRLVNRGFELDGPVGDLLLPVIRAMSMFTCDQPDALNAHENGMAYIALSKEIGIFFVISNDGQMTYLQNKDLAKRKLNVPELFEEAIKSLLSNKPNATVEVEDEFAVVEGDVYTTSLILLDHFWKTISFDFKGRPVVYPVNRSLFIITGDKEASGLKKSRKLAKELLEEFSYPISANPIVLEGTKWRALYQ